MTAVNDELTVRLVEQGARMIAEQGLAGLSLRKLAAAVGTSTMAVYTRFGDKRRLLAAMHHEGFRRLGAALAAAGAGSDPLAALTEQGRAYRSAALASPHLFDLMFGPSGAVIEPDEAGATAAAESYGALVSGVQRCLDAGVMRGDAERIAMHLWVVVHGMVSLELAGELPDSNSYDDALAFAALPFLGPGT